MRNAILIEIGCVTDESLESLAQAVPSSPPPQVPISSDSAKIHSNSYNSESVLTRLVSDKTKSLEKANESDSESTDENAVKLASAGES